MSINRTVLVGRLTKDPEIKYSQNGVAMCRFTVAVNRQFKKDGQPDADFINCLVFNKTAENLANFQKKGSLIGVDGRIQTGSYQKDGGSTVYTTDVVADSIQFLEPKQQQPGQAQPQQQYQQMNQPQYHKDYQPQPVQQQQHFTQQPQYQQMSTTHLTPMNQQQGQQFAQQMGAVIQESDLPF